MSVFFYEPFHNFDRFLDEVVSPRAIGCNFQQGSTPNPVNGTVRAFKPKMDLHEDSAKNLVTATFELPGVKKEDVQLDVHDNHLTVSSQTQSSTEHEENGFTVRERRAGKFSRTLQLPRGIKDEEIKAVMADGVLTVTFPKSSPEQAPKKITIA